MLRSLNYKIVVTGRNCADKVDACLTSIAEQTNPNYEVCVVDDVSDDPKQWEALTKWESRFRIIYNTERKYAMANQQVAWLALDPDPEDVVVFVDLDDRLAHPEVLNVLDAYYRAGAWMTYGSYRPDPIDHPSARTCRPARPYSGSIILTNRYRRSPMCFNHLRTVQWHILSRLTPEDLKNRKGFYWQGIPDFAVMYPCLEMCGPRAFFVSEVLYVYSCDLESAVWRSIPKIIRIEGADLRARPPKERLGGLRQPIARVVL